MRRSWGTPSRCIQARIWGAFSRQCSFSTSRNTPCGSRNGALSGASMARRAQLCATLALYLLVAASPSGLPCSICLPTSDAPPHTEAAWSRLEPSAPRAPRYRSRTTDGASVMQRRHLQPRLNDAMREGFTSNLLATACPAPPWPRSSHTCRRHKYKPQTLANTEQG